MTCTRYSSRHVSEHVKHVSMIHLPNVNSRSSFNPACSWSLAAARERGAGVASGDDSGSGWCLRSGCCPVPSSAVPSWVVPISEGRQTGLTKHDDRDAVFLASLENGATRLETGSCATNESTCPIRGVTQSIAAANLIRRPGAAIEPGASSTYRESSAPQQGSCKWPTKRFHTGGDVFFNPPKELCLHHRAATSSPACEAWGRKQRCCCRHYPRCIHPEIEILNCCESHESKAASLGPLR